MDVKLIGKHEKDSRACRDGLALTLNELMATDTSIVYVDCDLMGCINTKRKPSTESASEKIRLCENRLAWFTCQAVFYYAGPRSH